jgi:hypothetical protein
MPLPLAVGLAAGAGALATGFGYAAARKRKRKTARLIREGYGKARTNLGTRQMDIREAYNTNLVARNVGGAGLGPMEAATPESLDAVLASRPRGGPTSDYKKWRRTAEARAEAARIAEDRAAARKGATGAAGTYAAGVHDQLSGEFDKEYEDLNFRARAAIDANDAQGANDMLAAIAGGVQTGATAYGLASSFGAAGSGSAGFKGAFGIDVVDPLEGLNYGFNVRVG